MQTFYGIVAEYFPSLQIAQDIRISELPTTTRRARKPDPQISNHAHLWNTGFVDATKK